MAAARSGLGWDDPHVSSPRLKADFPGSALVFLAEDQGHSVFLKQMTLE
jgi:hypothetical protein